MTRLFRSSWRHLQGPEFHARVAVVGILVLVAGLLAGCWFLPAWWQSVAATGAILAAAGFGLARLASAGQQNDGGET